MQKKMNKMTRRFVAGSRSGELQSMTAATARRFCARRKSDPRWWEEKYPIIYELVPVSLEQVKSKAPKTKGGG